VHAPHDEGQPTEAYQRSLIAAEDFVDAAQAKILEEVREPKKPMRAPV
jgi:hypothetical protein